jgi:hypothetical protein
MKNRFYMACLRDNVGSNVSFHRKNGSGYHTGIDQAEVYTKEEAQLAWNRGRDFDLPLCADQVDALAVWHVDCQLLPNETTIEPGCTEYVGFVKGRWDGNDVYWLTRNTVKTDFNQAVSFEAPDQDPDVVYLPRHMAEKVKRRTIQIQNVNRRKMITAAGLVIPAHIKKAKRRKDSGLNRMNCPCCGRINWQLNPYDFSGCSNTDCAEWRPSWQRGYCSDE